MKRKLIVGLLLIVPAVHAQDLSRTPMRVETRPVERRGFTLTITTPDLSRYEGEQINALVSSTAVDAYQDPAAIEGFLNCWNDAAEGKSKRSEILEERLQCAYLDYHYWEAEQQGKKPVHVFHELPFSRATLIVVSNLQCIGAYIVPGKEAHGDIARSVAVSCRGTTHGFGSGQSRQGEKQ